MSIWRAYGNLGSPIDRGVKGNKCLCISIWSTDKLFSYFKTYGERQYTSLLSSVLFVKPISETWGYLYGLMTTRWDVIIMSQQWWSLTQWNETFNWSILGTIFCRARFAPKNHRLLVLEGTWRSGKNPDARVILHEAAARRLTNAVWFHVHKTSKLAESQVARLASFLPLTDRHVFHGTRQRGLSCYVSFTTILTAAAFLDLLSARLRFFFLK